MDKNRNSNIDIIRLFALLMVFLVHAFLNNGYYRVPIESPMMIIGTCLRQFSMICVPLFLLITGYLYGGREVKFNKKHLLKLSKVLIPYSIVTLLLYFTLKYYNQLGSVTFLTMLLGFENNGYTWYIEMYIGLYLLIPFINTGYNKLEKDEKERIIFVMVFLTFLPTLINPYYLCIPDFWTLLYPFAYYLVGMYLKEYRLNFKLSSKLIILVVAAGVHFINAISLFKYNILHSANDFNNFFCFIIAVIVFDLFNNINTSNFKTTTKKTYAILAEAVLPAYMLSKISDTIVYQEFVNKLIPTVDERIVWVLPIVLGEFVITLLAGLIVAKTSDVIIKQIVKNSVIIKRA